MQIYEDHFFGRTKTSERRMQANRGRRAKRGLPMRPLYLAAWAHLFWASWPRLHRSFFPKLPRDLKTTIKNSPPTFSRGRRWRNTELETERQKAAAGEDRRGKRHRNHLRKAPPFPPSGVSINTTVKTSTISITIFVIHFIPLIV